METSLIITDLTRMSGDRVCVAGVTDEGHTVRPEFESGWIRENWLYDQQRLVVRPFARVRLDLLRPCPQPPHTEDWIVRPNFKRGEGLLCEQERFALLQKIDDPKVNSIFGAEIHQEPGFFIREGEGIRSLGTVKVSSIDFVSHRCFNGKWDYRISFGDCAAYYYRLGVTDLAFRSYVDFLRDRQGVDCDEIGRRLTRQFRKATVYFRIGLARPTWEKHPHCCFLQINGVYTFPDYLEGRCFADFKN